ncbi:MAG: hypothetical protein JJT81_15670 [Rubellimicrobium sp.]|nr:hypothetical protein [Rubellimicrobium sp.]
MSRPGRKWHGRPETAAGQQPDGLPTTGIEAMYPVQIIRRIFQSVEQQTKIVL